MIQEILEKLVFNGLKTLNLETKKIIFEPPTNSDHGDYATPLPLALAKEYKSNPYELAEKIVTQLNKTSHHYIGKISVAAPGFINFYLSPAYFIDVLKDILALGDNYGRNQTLAGQKIMIEFTDPNPFKEFHIGHLMSNTIGESLSRIIEANSAEVKRVNYQGDVGIHVAKTIWGMMKNDQEPTYISTLAQAYAVGSKAYDGDESSKKEIVTINQKIYDRSEPKINKIYDTGRALSLAYFETIYRQLGTHFDYYFFESETGGFGKKVVLEWLEKGVFEESDQAVVFRGEKFKFHTRVFLNSQGLPTYEAKELGLARLKYEQYPYDQSLIVTGNEIVDYFRVLLAAMKQIFPDLAQKTHHIAHGMLRLRSGKMSSRTGQVVTFVELFEMIKKQVLNKMTDKKKMENVEEVAEWVAIAALKYSILKQDIGRDIIFDLEKSISLTGDSGPYLQYTYVRTQSVLEKAGSKGLKADLSNPETPVVLERLLSYYPQVVKRACLQSAPQQICQYLIDLASVYNAYYNNNQIISDRPTASYRLALTQAVGRVIKNGLDLLGIASPKRM